MRRRTPGPPRSCCAARALLAPPEAADPVYRRRCDGTGRPRGDFERARTELLYGKWLRRRRLARRGPRPAAGRAARLRALRAPARGRIRRRRSCGRTGWPGRRESRSRAGAVPPGLSRLTPQQMRIARGVAPGSHQPGGGSEPVGEHPAPSTITCATSSPRSGPLPDGAGASRGAGGKTAARL
ncbi:hypothetical protein LT493_03890 [Streptomyces tricolor]|nr:hypothetical protein [Streptomyces tricolor]